jgi:hypothetical protein
MEAVKRHGTSRDRFWRISMSYGALALLLLLAVSAGGEEVPKGVLAQLCAGRSCGSHEVKSAGRGAKGEKLDVVRIALPKEELCQPYENWLVVQKEKAAPVVQLLLSECNDGYGAARLGEDVIEVGDNLFIHKRTGGSAWRWGRDTTVQLSPLEVIEETSSSFHTLTPNSSSQYLGWRELDFHSEWVVPACESHDESKGEYAKRYEGRALSIPSFKTARVWDVATQSLGDCGVFVDSSGLDGLGFVVHGRPAAHGKSARFRAMLTETNELWVEVQDDYWISGAKSWLYDDHLEIWLGKREGDFFCISEKEKPLQWGVRVGDGKVFPGLGSPAPLAVKAFHADSGSARIRLALPGPVERITVVYSDSDDGKTQERLIATSKLIFGNLATLGSAVRIPPEIAECTLNRSAKEWMVTKKRREWKKSEAIVNP